MASVATIATIGAELYGYRARLTRGEGSVRTSMATIPNALLIGISSPYARRGLL